MSGDALGESTFRPPIVNERAILKRLVEPEFAGRAALREKLAACLVRKIAENSGLEIVVPLGAPARTSWRIPTQGEHEDADGASIHVLSHAVGGAVHALEAYKDDGSKLLFPPDSSRPEVFCPTLVR